MAGEVLKSYLITLGFKPNEDDLKKFNDSVARAEQTILSLGESVAQVVSSVSAGVLAMSKDLREFAVIASRSGTTVAGLQALRFAAKQVGLGAGEMTAAIDSLGQTIRTNPVQAAAILANPMFNVKLWDPVTHKIRDTKDIFNDLMAVMYTKKPGTPAFQVAMSMLEKLGISSKEVLTILPAYKDFVNAQIEMTNKSKEAGVDWDDLGNKSSVLVQKLNKLNESVEIFGGLITKNFIGPVTDTIDKITDFIDHINSLDKATKGWSTTIITILGTMGAWKIFLGLLGKFFPQAASTLATVSGLTALQAVLGTVLGVLTRLAGPITTFWSVLNGGALNEGEQDILDKMHRGEIPTGNEANSGGPYGGAKGGSFNSRVQDAVKFFMDKGWSYNAAVGIAANLERESGFGPRAEGKDSNGKMSHGVAQWQGDRWQAVMDYAKANNLDPYDLHAQYAALDYELRHGPDQGARAAGQELGGNLATPQQAVDIFAKKFERPKDPFAASRISGKMAEQIVNITANNNVVVNGATDPTSTGRAVGREIDKSNGALLRNTKSAVQ